MKTFLNLASLLLCIFALNFSSVVLHSIHQRLNVLQLGARRQTVAEIEDMSRATAHGFKNLRRFACNRFRCPLDDERRREISLHADVRRNDLSRRSQIGLPINPEDVRAAGDEVGPVAVRAEGEGDDRNAAFRRQFG